MIFPQEQVHHFHINGTSVIGPVKRNQLSFPALKSTRVTSCPSLQYLVDQIQVQEPILVVVTDQMPDHTMGRG